MKPAAAQRSLRTASYSQVLTKELKMLTLVQQVATNAPQSRCVAHAARASQLASKPHAAIIDGKACHSMARSPALDVCDQDCGVRITPRGNDPAREGPVLPVLLPHVQQGTQEQAAQCSSGQNRCQDRGENHRLCAVCGSCRRWWGWRGGRGPIACGQQRMPSKPSCQMACYWEQTPQTVPQSQCNTIEGRSSAGTWGWPGAGCPAEWGGSGPSLSQNSCSMSRTHTTHVSSVEFIKRSS